MDLAQLIETLSIERFIIIVLLFANITQWKAREDDKKIYFEKYQSLVEKVLTSIEGNTAAWKMHELLDKIKDNVKWQN